MIKIIREARNVKLFFDMPSDEKVERLMAYPYIDDKYYHISEEKNVASILRNGIQGDEIWMFKGKPSPEYTHGYLFQFNGDGLDLRIDRRWEDKHNVFVSTEPIPAWRIEKVFVFFDQVSLREDDLALQLQGRTEEEVVQLINQYKL